MLVVQMEQQLSYLLNLVSKCRVPMAHALKLGTWRPAKPWGWELLGGGTGPQQGAAPEPCGRSEHRGSCEGEAALKWCCGTSDRALRGWEGANCGNLRLSAWNMAHWQCATWAPSSRTHVAHTGTPAYSSWVASSRFRLPLLVPSPCTERGH